MDCQSVVFIWLTIVWPGFNMWMCGYTAVVPPDTDIRPRRIHIIRELCVQNEDYRVLVRESSRDMNNVIDLCTIITQWPRSWLTYPPARCVSAVHPFTVLQLTEYRACVTCVNQVLVVGAGGRTGSIVLEKLLSRKDQFAAKGLVR
eukprot:3199792-Pyramimonas_sp.AAC.1